jgi:hypothetical protein
MKATANPMYYKILNIKVYKKFGECLLPFGSEFSALPPVV